MILFLEYSAGGIRGGELYNAHFHKFIKVRYNVIPEQIPAHPLELSNPFRHSIISLKMVREKKPDLIVLDVSSGIRNLFALRWMKRTGRKSLLIVQEERMNLRWNNFLVRWLVRQSEKYLIRNSDIFVVNSRYSAELVKKKGARQGVPIIIAHPGLENILMDSNDQPRPVRGEGEIFDLLYVGICRKNKGIIHLIKALNELKDCDVRLNLVGQYYPGSRYHKKLKKYIKANNLEEKVIFHGFLKQDRLLEIYRKSSLYVHPSLMEGYGMVLAEAISYGLPIVSTTAGAIPELVENGVNGILVSPGDSDGLAVAIRNFYRDPDLRFRISNNNLEKAKKLHTWQEYDAKLEQELIPALEAVAGIVV